MDNLLKTKQNVRLIALKLFLTERDVPSALNQTLKKITSSVKAVIKHVERGDLSDHKVNAIVWHDLDTAIHYVNLLTKIVNENEIETLAKYEKHMRRLKAMKPCVEIKRQNNKLSITNRVQTDDRQQKQTQ